MSTVKTPPAETTVVKGTPAQTTQPKASSGVLAAAQHKAAMKEETKAQKTQEQLEKEKVDREREIMRDPHETEKKAKAVPMSRPPYQDKDGNVVRALRIKAIIPEASNPTKSKVHFVEEGHSPVTVTAPWLTAHLPRPGGYLVFDQSSDPHFMAAQEFTEKYHRGRAA